MTIEKIEDSREVRYRGRGVSKVAKNKDGIFGIDDIVPVFNKLGVHNIGIVKRAVFVLNYVFVVEVGIGYKESIVHKGTPCFN